MLVSSRSCHVRVYGSSIYLSGSAWLSTHRMNKLRTLAYPTIALVAAFTLLGGTAFARDDSSTRTSYPEKPAVSIVGDGNVLVRGAEVTSVDSGSITAKTVFDGATWTWNIDTDGDTSYLSAKGSSASRGDIETGDTVSFSGSLEGTFDVDAAVVRVWNYETNDATHLTGTVTSVASGSFVIDTGNRKVTIDVDNSTDITLGNDDDASVSDLRVGQKVKVEGLYDGDEFDASSVIGIASSGHAGKDDDHHGWNGVLSFLHGLKLGWHK